MMLRKAILGGALAAVLGVAGVGGYLFLSSRPPPPPPSLTTTTAVDTTEPATTNEPGTPTEPCNLDGTWEVRAEESFVGYRVQEVFLTQDLPNQAVGRTGAVEGSMTIEGTRVVEVEVTADLRELESDEALRDRAIRDRGLESNRFPEATFVLTTPFELEALPAPGEVITIEVSGELTLHGETRPVEIVLEAVLQEDGSIRVVGSLEVAFSDYAIDPPNVAGAIRVEEQGMIELDLVFVQSS